MVAQRVYFCSILEWKWSVAANNGSYSCEDCYTPTHTICRCGQLGLQNGNGKWKMETEMEMDVENGKGCQSCCWNTYLFF